MLQIQETTTSSVAPIDHSSMACCVPVGFRFEPTDEQLVGYFLYNKVLAMTLPPPQEGFFVEPLPFDIPEEDLFDKKVEPWEIWNKFDGPKLLDQDLYFFSTLKKVNPKGSRISRKVGKGTWSEGEPCDLVYSEETGNPIGRKRKFRYENKPNPDHHARWCLDEYCLVDAAGNSYTDWVICRLRQNDRSWSSSGNKRKFHDGEEKRIKKPGMNKKARNVEEEVALVVPAEYNNNVAKFHHDQFDDPEVRCSGITSSANYNDQDHNQVQEQEYLMGGSGLLSCDIDQVLDLEEYCNGNIATQPVRLPQLPNIYDDFDHQRHSDQIAPFQPLINVANYNFDQEYLHASCT